MLSERVVVSAEEVSRVQPLADVPPHIIPKMNSPVPVWGRIGMSVLVLFLPLLALVAIILRVAFRNQPPSVRYAWVSFMSTLLIVSGFLTSIAAVVTFTMVPVPAIVNAGLPDLDERNQFLALPMKSTLSSSDASEKLKPLVIVVSPTAHLWNQQDTPSSEFGAGVLLFGDKTGYLFATANHVVNGGKARSATAPKDVMVATQSGVWSSAQVIAIAPALDMALVWVGRHAGSAPFLQPIAAPKDGSQIFVIGHPEGLKFTLSTGIISGLHDQTVQVSAAISPGNSGGPVYDDHGNLVGIVTSKFDNNVDPNAENIGFATNAEMLIEGTNWIFSGDGKQLLGRYTSALQAASKAERVATPAS
jgi:S1-C subfamily serine protease